MEIRGKSSALSAADAIAKHLRDWLSSPPDIINGGDKAPDRGETTNRMRQNKRNIGSDSNKASRRFDGIIDEGLIPPLGEGSLRSDSSASTREDSWFVLREGYDRDEGQRVQVADAGVSMGVYSDGNPYGVPDGLIYSFPVQCSEGMASISLPPPPSSPEDWFILYFDVIPFLYSFTSLPFTSVIFEEVTFRGVREVCFICIQFFRVIIEVDAC